MHASQTFEIFYDQSYISLLLAIKNSDLQTKMSESDFKAFRGLVIDIILATDMKLVVMLSFI